MYSDYVAIAALMISAVSLYLSWRRDAKDRSHLFLKINYDLENNSRRNLNLLVVNDGCRPTTITSVTAKTNLGEVIPVSTIQKILNEGQSTTYKFPYGTIRGVVARFDVIDIYDNVYVEKASHKIRRLQREHAHHYRDEDFS